jgi:hypothetical protein
MDFLKRCNDCGNDKPNSCFSKKGQRLQHKCKECQSAYNKEYRLRNYEKLSSASRDYYKENQEKVLAKKAEYRENNRESLRLKNKEYYEVNKDSYKDYRRARKKRLKVATPSWLTDQHWLEIEAIYNLARDCKLVSGQDYHVDHMVPIKGKNICGLHVPWNLQVLPADINQSKHNKELPDYD